MNTKRSYPLSHWIPLLVILISVPVMLSCSLTGNLGQSPLPTVAPTLPPQVTVLVVVQSPTPEAVLLPSNTPEPTQTEKPVETATVALPTETETAIPVPEFIEIKNIQAIGWNFANSTKCKDQKVGCWFLISYKQEGSLEGKDFIFIDPNWANPYLVFWQKFTSKGYSYFGFLEITADNEVGWSQIQGYKDSNYSWKEEAIDLTTYKGREIQFRMMFVPTTDVFSTQQKNTFNEHQWAISPFRIVPNYNP